MHRGWCLDLDVGFWVIFKRIEIDENMPHNSKFFLKCVVSVSFVVEKLNLQGELFSLKFLK